MNFSKNVQCPACAELGGDKNKNHLKIYENGRFSCIVASNFKDKVHDARILELRPDLRKPREHIPLPQSKPFKSTPSAKNKELGPCIARYIYTNSEGKPLYEVWRHEPKDFRQHGYFDGQLKPTMEGIERVPYQLPDIVQADTVWIVEGEKDANSLKEMGIVATCNAGGAGKWEEAWNEYFVGKSIILCGDNDEPGRAHMSLIERTIDAKEVKKVRLPDRFKDISDYLRGKSPKEQEKAILDLLKTIPKSMPEIMSWEEFDRMEIKPPDPLIHGVLDVGAKMVFGGGSKSYKSWASVELAVAVATGTEWLGFKCEAGKVLYINMEITPYKFRDRIRNVVRSKRLLGTQDNLHVWNLRGFAQGIEKLRPKLEERMGSEYKLAILDPAYKLYGERSENSNEDMAIVLNEIEAIAVNTGAAIVIPAHFSKGNQSAKSHLDRISGAGAWARDPDVFMTMTPHASADCLTVETTLRDHKAIDSFVVEWRWPLMIRRGDLDPEDLKQATASEGKKYDINFMLDNLVGEMTAEQWRKSCSEAGMSKASYYEWKKKAEDSGKVCKSNTGLYWRSPQGNWTPAS